MICRGVNPIFAGPAAVTVMVFYNFVPFAIVAGAPDYLARLRLFLILSSVLLIAFGAYQTWRAKRSVLPRSKLAAPVLLFSAAATGGMILFAQPIANFLAGGQ